jgi:microcompartment protein CcmL/EutN
MNWETLFQTDDAQRAMVQAEEVLPLLDTYISSDLLEMIAVAQIADVLRTAIGRGDVPAIDQAIDAGWEFLARGQ